MSGIANFYFRPSSGEWIHTSVTPSDNGDCGIVGSVAEGGQRAKDALVLLYKAEGSQRGELISSVVTDSDGEFAFGPLEGGELYVIKVYRGNIKIRELEISV